MKRRGSILYLILIIVALLSLLGSILLDIGKSESQATQIVYRSEICMNLAEAAAEEFFINVERLMNRSDGGGIDGIYERLREETEEGDVIELDKERDIPEFLVPDSRKLASQLKAAMIVEGRIRDIRSIDINPNFQDGGEGKKIRPDPREKEAVLEVTIVVSFEGMERKLSVTRPLKVVNTTIAPLSPFTFFLNDPSWPYLAHWSARMGEGFESSGSGNFQCSETGSDQKSVILDHGWQQALNLQEMTLEDMAQGFEDQVMAGKFPPGRVFVNSGIIPVTNGNREGGMLQRAFFSAETELLPPSGQIELEQLREAISGGGLSSSLSEEDQALLEVLEPHNGKLHTRYVGHGSELRHNQVEINGRERKGYKDYFETFMTSGEWSSETDSRNPSKSGLDLFGRVELKREARDRDQSGEGGIFSQIWDGIREVTRSVLNAFVERNYNVRISPTLVYGKALMSYYRVMDYQYTRAEEFRSVWEARQERVREDQPWWRRAWDDISGAFENLISTFRIGLLGPGQYPIPEFPDSLLDESSTDNRTPYSQSDKSRFVNDEVGWSEETFDNFLDLPSGLRTPAFFSYLKNSRTYQQQFFGEDLKEKVPAGAILAPYNNAIGNYLKEFYHESSLKELFNDQSKGVTALSETRRIFMDNKLDQQLDDQWADQYKSVFKEMFEPDFELADFNPFLYYRKATDYVSSIHDYTRKTADDQPVNFLREKYYNSERQRLELNGVIYITGTAVPLRMSEFLAEGQSSVIYKGKAIIITFGEVIFDCGLKKDGFDFETGLGPTPGEDDSVLTVVALGGIRFLTEQPVQASIYSFMFPPKAYAEGSRRGYRFQLFGTFGASQLNLSDVPCGGVVRYDRAHFIQDLAPAQLNSYYHAALTDEIGKFSWESGWQ